MAQRTFLKGDHRLHDSLQLRLGSIRDHRVRHGERQREDVASGSRLVGWRDTERWRCRYLPAVVCVCATGAKDSTFVVGHDSTRV